MNLYFNIITEILVVFLDGVPDPLHIVGERRMRFENNFAPAVSAAFCYSDESEPTARGANERTPRELIAIQGRDHLRVLVSDTQVPARTFCL